MPTPPTSPPATPLPRKLGLLSAKATSMTVTLMGAPENFVTQLGALPPAVHLIPRLTPATNLAICFVRSLPELHTLFEILTTQLPPKASVWIARPKQHHHPGFNEHEVRNAGLALGLVDYKICSFNDDWSGIKFTWRRERRPSA